jgi:hypothetical protein
MRAGAVGHPFDQRRPQVAARPLGRPARRRQHGQEVVAVDAQRRDAAPTPRAAKVVPSPPAMAWKVEIAHWLLTTFRITGAR